MADGEQPSIKEVPNVTELTVDLLGAYVRNNKVTSDDFIKLIQSTRDALAGPSAPATPPPLEPEHVRAVSIRKSLASPDHIISLIDGKPYQMLKPHLSKHGLTPEAYRARYKLPASYPLVAPSYSENRRASAARIGLGRKAPKAVPTAQPSASPSPKAEAAQGVTKAKAAVKTKPAKMTAAAAAKPHALPATLQPESKTAKPTKAKLPRSTIEVAPIPDIAPGTKADTAQALPAKKQRRISKAKTEKAKASRRVWPKAGKTPAPKPPTVAKAPDTAKAPQSEVPSPAPIKETTPPSA